MRKLIAILVALAMTAVVAPVLADPTDTVVVTLTPSATADITCNQSVWAPVCGIGADKHTSTTWGKIENTGTIQVDITVSATDGDNSWTLEAAPGHNQFNMSWTTNAGYTALTTGEVSFAENMAYDGSQAFGLAVFMATSTSTNAMQNVTITWTAIAD